MSAKPSTLPRWATGGGALITTPSSGAQDTGHVPNTALTAQLANWFWNLVYQWVAWVSTNVDSLDKTSAAHEVEYIANPLTTRVTGASYEFTSIAARATPDNNRIVAVGNHGTIYTSDDFGQTWTSRSAPGGYTGDYAKVIYSNVAALYVAVGTTGAIHTSPDGASWTARTSGTTDDLQTVAENTTTLVAIAGIGGRTLISVNGTAWTSHAGAINSGTYFCGEVIFYSPTLKFYTRGTTGIADPAKELQSSSDGITWTAIDLTSLFNSGETIVGFAAARTTLVDGSSAPLMALTVDSLSQYSVLKTTNGTVWARVLGPLAGAVGAFSIAAGDRAVVLLRTTAANGRAYYTLDQGATWPTLFGTPTPLQNKFWALQMDNFQNKGMSAWVVPGLSAGSAAGTLFFSRFWLEP